MYSLHLKKAAVSSQNSLISQSMPSFLILAHNFYIEGNGKEGEVHKDLVLSKMAETFVVHVIFYLPGHGFRFYTSSSPVFQPFLLTDKKNKLLPIGGLSAFYPVEFHIEPPAPSEPLIRATSRAEALLRIYNPLDDSRRLKASPESFESLRGNYAYRREPSAYRILPIS